MAYWTNFDTTVARKRSFTMLESLVALFILSFGLLTIMNLTDRSLSYVSVFKDQLIATNLAQEGIELVRHRRDSNFLRRRQVDGCKTSDGCDANDQNDRGLLQSAFIFFLPGPCGFPPGDPWGCRPVLRRPADAQGDLISFALCSNGPICKRVEQDTVTGFYGYDLIGVTTRVTQFDRRIFIEREDTVINPGDPCCQRQREDLRVISTVTWPVRFSSDRRSVSLESYLTDHHP